MYPHGPRRMGIIRCPQCKYGIHGLDMRMHIKVCAWARVHKVCAGLVSGLQEDADVSTVLVEMFGKAAADEMLGKCEE